MTVNAFTTVFSCKMRRLTYLFLLWPLGLLAGYGFFYACRPFLSPLMPSLLVQPVSIVGFFVSIFLPFLFTSLSIVTHNPVYCLTVCFIKALAFGFTGSVVAYFYMSAGWLVRLIFLFSDCCTLPVLFLLWLNVLSSEERTHCQRLVLGCVLYCIAVIVIDYCVISPFLYGLI